MSAAWRPLLLKKNLIWNGCECSYLFERSDTTIPGIHYETYNNRTSNCTRSPKYVSICRRHIELQCSRRSPRRQRRHGLRPYGNQASEHLTQEIRSRPSCVIQAGQHSVRRLAALVVSDDR